MDQKLTLEQIKKELSKLGSSIKSDTIIKAQEFLKDYEISLQSFLGAGAFGLVMKGYDSINKRDVAVKIMVCQDDKQVKENLQEFQKMKLIKSSYVITSYEIYMDDSNESIYMITEYCPNGNLHSYYEKNKPLKQEEIIKIFNQILEGIKDIHSKNIIHSDLKPQNIVLTSNNSPKVCDLGLSKQLKNTSFTSIKGMTPFYASKEQIEGNIYKESDIYSAGTILCWLCGLNVEGDLMVNFQMKSGIFPKISNHPFEPLLQIALQMMNPIYKERISLNKVQDMLSQLTSNQHKKQKQKEQSSTQSQPSQSQIFSSQNQSDSSKEIKNGFWVFHLNNGDRYEGEWVNDKRSGFGIYYYKDGEKYIGEFKNNEFHGQGKLFFKNGSTYDGEWKHNCKNGYGIQLFGDKTEQKGEKYEGNWLNDKMNGKGTYFYKDGGKYDGEWIQDEMNGYGVYYYSNGDRYEGEFQNSLCHGNGKYYYANGDIYDGEWENDMKEGFGIQIIGSKISVKNKGDRYEGNWHNDEMNGKGQYFYNDGERYDGEWLNNKRHGDGIYYFKNGDKVEGKWESDSNEGLATYYYKNGKKVSHLYKNNKIIETKNL